MATAKRVLYVRIDDELLQRVKRAARRVASINKFVEGVLVQAVEHSQEDSQLSLVFDGASPPASGGLRVVGSDG